MKARKLVSNYSKYGSVDMLAVSLFPGAYARLAAQNIRY